MPVIYKIESPVGKVYIGQTWHLVRRRSAYTRHECKGQVKLYNSLEMYGFENHRFTVLCTLPSDVEQTVLDIYEVFYWQQHIDCGVEMLNLKEPGSRGRDSEEVRLKKSIARKGKSPSQAWLDSRRGRKLTPEHLENLKRAKQHISEETRKKMSEAKKGHTTWNKGKKHSEEHRRKLSEARRRYCELTKSTKQ